MKKADDHHISSQQTTVLLFIEGHCQPCLKAGFESHEFPLTNYLSVITITWGISPMFGHAHDNDYSTEI